MTKALQAMLFFLSVHNPRRNIVAVKTHDLDSRYGTKPLPRAFNEHCLGTKPEMSPDIASRRLDKPHLRADNLVLDGAQLRNQCIDLMYCTYRTKCFPHGARAKAGYSREGNTNSRFKHWLVKPRALASWHGASLLGFSTGLDFQ